MIGIEMPKDKNTAWGIVVPAFDKVNLGCFSASDEEKDIFVNAEEAILMMAEEHLNDGGLLKDLDQGYFDASREYADSKQWMAIDIAVNKISTKAKRINVSFPENFVTRLDRFVEKTDRYKDRSEFLLMAADKAIQDSRI